MMLNRRRVLRGLLAAPAIVAAGHIMPIKMMLPTVAVVQNDWGGWKIVHAGTRLSLGCWFDDFGNAEAAAREIERRYNVDRLAMRVLLGRGYETARDDILAIQQRQVGECFLGREKLPHGETIRIIQAWAGGAPLTQHQRREP